MYKEKNSKWNEKLEKMKVFKVKVVSESVKNIQKDLKNRSLET
jgi:hypothetical protein